MIGELKHRVIIQKPAVEKDEIGQEIEVFEEVTKVWAEIKPLTGRAYFEVKQFNSEITTQITIRYHEGIKAEMIALHKDSKYEVLYALNVDEQCKYLKLLCREKVI